MEEKLQRVLGENVAVVPYDPAWPELFQQEKEHLLSCLPPEMIGRIEHFGSTAVPNLVAKPIIDMLIEVRDLQETRRRIVPILEAQGYDYFWRPSTGEDKPPYYAWFIKRNKVRERTHHLHMVEANFKHWDRVLFRDYLIAHPECTAEYAKLKMRLAESCGQNRVAYTEGKTDFIVKITRRAKRLRGGDARSKT